MVSAFLIQKSVIFMVKMFVVIVNVVGHTMDLIVSAQMELQLKSMTLSSSVEIQSLTEKVHLAMEEANVNVECVNAIQQFLELPSQDNSAK